jgi:hypothetical protein
MRWFLLGAAGLHVAFMMFELFPWSLSVLLRIVSKKLPSGESFTCGWRIDTEAVKRLDSRNALR